MSNNDLEDCLLSAEQLDDKYNPDGDGEHPVITRSLWREAVSSCDTISGYWAWLQHQLSLPYELRFVGSEHHPKP